MKPFIISEITFKGHWRSSAMSSFVRLPRHSARDRKSSLHWFQTKVAKMALYSCNMMLSTTC